MPATLRRHLRLLPYYRAQLTSPEFRHRRRLIETLDDDRLRRDFGITDFSEHALPGLAEHRRSGWSAMMYNRYLRVLPALRGRRVLDSCCGFGWGSYLAGLTARLVTGVDRDARAIAIARALWPATGLAFVADDIIAFCQSHSRQFGAALAMETVEHFTRADGARLIAALAQALQPGGILLGSSAFPASRAAADALTLDNPHHLHVYTRADFTDLLLPHFTAIRFSGSSYFSAQRK